MQAQEGLISQLCDENLKLAEEIQRLNSRSVMQHAFTTAQEKNNLTHYLVFFHAFCKCFISLSAAGAV